MNERHLLKYLTETLHTGIHPQIELNVGDDCAAFRCSADDRIVTGTDMVIEGVHYSQDTALQLVGHKAISRALSDLAAMASEPVACLTAVSFTSAHDNEFAKNLLNALAEAADKYHMPIIGGDVSSGTNKLVIAVTVFGLPSTDRYITRSGAEPGDTICVTGALGGSLQSGRHLSFSPRIQEAQVLCRNFDLHAMIDLSDGMSTDLRRICKSSNVGALVHAKAIPVHDDLKRELSVAKPTHEEMINRAIKDGEDYELLFCMPDEQWPDDHSDTIKLGFEARPEDKDFTPASENDPEQDEADFRISRVGTCTSGNAIELSWSSPEKANTIMEPRGWEHQT